MLELEDSFLYQAGVDEGKRAMQSAISVTCDVSGIAMTEAQRSYLTTLNMSQLEQLHRSIAQTRAWPAA